MADKLKEYIMANRTELDSFVPQLSVWDKISEGLAIALPPTTPPAPPTPTGAATSWWKLLVFSASTVVVVTTAVVLSKKPADIEKHTAAVAAAPVPAAQPENVWQAPVDTPPPADTSLRNYPVPGVNETPGTPSDSFSRRMYPRPSFGRLPYVLPIPDAGQLLEDMADWHDDFIDEWEDSWEWEDDLDDIDEWDWDDGRRWNQGTKRKKSNASENSTPGSASIDTSFTGIDEIEVECSFCDINITPSKTENLTIKGGVTVEKKGLYSNDVPEYEIQCHKKGNVLEVKILNASDSWKSNVVFGSLNLNGSLAIALPAQTTDVLAKTFSGNVSTKNYKGKKLVIKTTSGNIHGEDITAKVTTKTFSGDVEFSNITGDVHSESSSGDQELKNITGAITVSSFSGDFEGINITGDATVKTSSGSQRFEGLTGNLYAASFSGDVSLNSAKGRYTISTSSGDIRGKKVELTSNSVFKTFSGDINFDFTNDVNALGFDLHSFSGSLVVDGGGNSRYTGQRELVVKRNESILVNGSSSSGSQEYK